MRRRNYTKITIKSIKQSLVRYTQSAGFPPQSANYTPFSKPLYASRNQDMINSLTTPERIHIITIRNTNRENPLMQEIVEILWETKNNNEKMQIWEISFGKTTTISGNTNTENTITTNAVTFNSSIKQLDLLGRLRSVEKAKSNYCGTRCEKTQIWQRTFIYFDVSYSSKLLKARQIRTWTGYITLCDILEIQRTL